MADTKFKDKLRQTILTDAGRHVFLAVGNGVGTLVYTRATLSSRKPVDGSNNQLDDEAIRQITSLPDDLKEGHLQRTPVADNHFSVISDFDNKNQPDDINFSSIGWYAKAVKDNKDVITETLIAITFTNNDHEVLAAGSPDHLSTDIISAELDMTISNAANIDMTVNEIGYVTRAELNTWQTEVKNTFDQTISNNEKNTTITIRGENPVKADANHTFTLDTYTKTEIDQMVAQAGKGAGINTVQGVAPDNTGNVNLGTVFYLKSEVDQKFQAQQNTINDLNRKNGAKDTQIESLNNQLTGANNQINDLVNRVKKLEEGQAWLNSNAVIGKRFPANQEAQAQQWENNNPNDIAMIEK